MGVYAFNFIDRQLLVILQESIKAELELSDTQLGLLTGFAFSMFYATLGIPIALLADKYNRVKIVAICLVIWSGITAITGLVTNYLQLVIARIGVGIGEAGCTPPTHAIISDYYPVEERGTAISIYSLGIYLGIFIGFLGGGILDQYYGWRIAFFGLGLPGVLFAGLLYTYVKEPQRGTFDPLTDTHQHSFWEVAQFLFSKKAFIYLVLGAGFSSFVQYSMGNWAPPFLSRYHGMTSEEIGIAMAIIVGIGGAIGTFAGGYLSDYFGKHSKRWYMWIPMITGLLSIPCFVGGIFLSQKSLVLGLYFPSVIFISMYLAPSVAITQSLALPNMRAAASSILFFVGNIIGLGGGPLFVGILSDYLVPKYGDQSLRYALLSVVVAGFLSSLLYYLAGKSLVNKSLQKEIYSET
uniref:MFS transporter n=1 Tax=Roseihalotalea indica TaxID=2867963 RepID=A0AA49PZ13_9BACT|nr:MFS transporter [Tunicatimonas sp. TK19036]